MISRVELPLKQYFVLYNSAVVKTLPDSKGRDSQQMPYHRPPSTDLPQQ